MTDAEVIEIARQAMLMCIKLGAPIMIIGLLVGVIISLIQALTQIQEMTLSFVPKIIAIFLALFILMPGLVSILVPYTQELMGLVAGFGTQPPQ